jgi:hypothetical protein
VISKESTIDPKLIPVPTNEVARPDRRPTSASAKPIRPRIIPSRLRGIERSPRNGTQQIRAAIMPRTKAETAIALPFL